jgi:hypothetical protein
MEGLCAGRLRARLAIDVDGDGERAADDEREEEREYTRRDLDLFMRSSSAAGGEVSRGESVPLEDVDRDDRVGIQEAVAEHRPLPVVDVRELRDRFLSEDERVLVRGCAADENCLAIAQPEHDPALLIEWGRMTHRTDGCGTEWWLSIGLQLRS